MGYTITPAEIEHMQQYLKEHPINHAYDEEAELFDNDVPSSELAARTCYRLLEELGKLPD